jgi:hypothetical protein
MLDLNAEQVLVSPKIKGHCFSFAALPNPYCFLCFCFLLFLPQTLPGTLQLPSQHYCHCCCCYCSAAASIGLASSASLLMVKIKSRQEKTLGEKHFIGLNAATPGSSTRGCLPADSQSEPSSLLVQPERRYGMQVKNCVCTNHGSVPHANEGPHLPGSQ